MKVVSPSFELLNYTAFPAQAVEIAARNCYKSEDRIAPGTAEDMVRRLGLKEHTPMWEFATATVRFVVDRGVSHELVRHRLASYAQESTRYCNYGKGQFGSELTFIRPCFWPPESDAYLMWCDAMRYAESMYMQMLQTGATAQEARSVLPCSTKTEVIMSTNFREWYHVFSQRTTPAAHPQMREVMIPCLREFIRLWPEFFEYLREHTT